MKTITVYCETNKEEIDKATFTQSLTPTTPQHDCSLLFTFEEYDKEEEQVVAYHQVHLRALISALGSVPCTIISERVQNSIQCAGKLVLISSVPETHLPVHVTHLGWLVKYETSNHLPHIIFTLDNNDSIQVCWDSNLLGDKLPLQSLAPYAVASYGDADEESM